MTQTNSQCAQKIAGRNPKAAAEAHALIVKSQRKVAEHGIFIRQECVDPPQVAQWRWHHG